VVLIFLFGFALCITVFPKHEMIVPDLKSGDLGTSFTNERKLPPMRSQIDLPFDPFYSIDRLQQHESKSLFHFIQSVLHSANTSFSKKEVAQNFNGVIYLTPGEIEDAISDAATLDYE
jgi:hypothetical protein